MSVAENTARGNAICTRLKELGEKPAWLECTEDRIAIGFELISAHPIWWKAFHFDATHARPEDFTKLLNDWRKKVRKEIHIHLPSLTVQRAIAMHGLANVMFALKHRVYA